MNIAFEYSNLKYIGNCMLIKNVVIINAPTQYAAPLNQSIFALNTIEEIQNNMKAIIDKREIVSVANRYRPMTISLFIIGRVPYNLLKLLFSATENRTLKRNAVKVKITIINILGCVTQPITVATKIAAATKPNKAFST